MPSTCGTDVMCQATLGTPRGARLEQVLSSVLDRRKERAERRTTHIAELRKRSAEADAKLKRLYDAIEIGIADVSDLMLKDRVTELRSIRDQARAERRAGRECV